MVETGSQEHSEDQPKDPYQEAVDSFNTAINAEQYDSSALQTAFQGVYFNAVQVDDPKKVPWSELQRFAGEAASISEVNNDSKSRKFFNVLDAQFQAALESTQSEAQIPQPKRPATGRAAG